MTWKAMDRRRDRAYYSSLFIRCKSCSIEALLDSVWEPTTERLEGCYEEIIRLSKLVHDLSLLTKFKGFIKVL
jgi:hypothetical protein